MGIEFEIRAKKRSDLLAQGHAYWRYWNKNHSRNVFFSRYKFYETYTKGGLNQCTPTFFTKDAYFPMMPDNTSFIVV